MTILLLTSCKDVSKTDIQKPSLSNNPKIEEIVENENIENIVPSSSNQTLQKDSSKIFNLNNDFKIIITNNKITITLNNSKHWDNANIYRQPDESGQCFSEGFIGITNDSSFFEIHQQICSGWNIINEDIKFDYSNFDNLIKLHQIKLTYFDNRLPDKDPEIKVYSKVNFGDLSFEKIHLDSLLDRLLIND